MTVLFHLVRAGLPGLAHDRRTGLLAHICGPCDRVCMRKLRADQLAPDRMTCDCTVPFVWCCLCGRSQGLTFQVCEDTTYARAR